MPLLTARERFYYGVPPGGFAIRIEYDSAKMTRGEAWENLCKQQVPGCACEPFDRSGVLIYARPWRKAHDPSRKVWAWVCIA
jgi:hypothetical protein